MTVPRPIGIGFLGAGTVGGALISKLTDEQELISAKTGLNLQVRHVAVRHIAKARSFAVDDVLVTSDPFEVVHDPTVQLVVEVMGGQDPAGDLVLAALKEGKPVVTANKELIAARGPELIAAAEEAGVPLLFEASVGGGIPIIRPLAETLAGEKIEQVLGIVNGTTNYILTRMVEGHEYAEALAEAQQLGFAEPDPTADVTGADAAAKAAILASLAFGTWVGLEDVSHEGIDTLEKTDIDFARFLNYEIKLLAIASRTESGVNARVYPAMIPQDHPLASIRGATNAIFITGPSIQELLFAGPGAGGEPTASAVLGDVIDAARETLAGAQVAPRIQMSPGAIVDFGDIPTKWYIRIEVEDRPGVLAQVAQAFGEAGVSIRSVWQEGQGSGATLLIVTHRAPEAAQRMAVEGVRQVEAVRGVLATIRVEGPEA